MSTSHHGLTFVSLVCIIGIGCSQDSNVSDHLASRGAGLIEDRLPEGKLVGRKDSTVHCVLIGVNKSIVAREYDLTDLQFAEADTNLLRGAWEAFGVPPSNIHILTGEAATEKGLVECIQAVAGESIPDDTLIIHFGGHGISTEGKSQLLLHDRALPLARLLHHAVSARISRVLLLIDACQSSGVNMTDVAQTSALPGEFCIGWIASAKLNQVAYESASLKQGVFASTLARILGDAEQYDINHDGYLGTEELAAPLLRQVSVEANNRGAEQTPEFGMLGRNTDRIVRLRPGRWAMECNKRGMRPSVTAHIPRRLPEGHHAWVCVRPLDSNGGRKVWGQWEVRWSDSTHGVVTDTVGLGTKLIGNGEEYALLLVDANADLDQELRHPDEDLSTKWDDKLATSVRCEIRVMRRD